MTPPCSRCCDQVFLSPPQGVTQISCTAPTSTPTLWLLLPGTSRMDSLSPRSLHDTSAGPCHTPHHVAPQKHQKTPKNHQTQAVLPGTLERLWSSGTGEKLNSKREKPSLSLSAPTSLPQAPLSPLPCQLLGLGALPGTPPAPQGQGIVLENTSGCLYLQE